MLKLDWCLNVFVLNRSHQAGQPHVRHIQVRARQVAGGADVRGQVLQHVLTLGPKPRHAAANEVYLVCFELDRAEGGNISATRTLSLRLQMFALVLCKL